MFDGHPIVQVASNGQIVLDVPKSFESIFDVLSAAEKPGSILG